MCVLKARVPDAHPCVLNTSVWSWGGHGGEEKGELELLSFFALSVHLYAFVFQTQLSATSVGYQDNEIQGVESFLCGFLPDAN